jgi:glycosyltransferase involved in cell wall biosynthesis
MYPFFHSNRNQKNIEFDRNVEKVLKAANAKYVWLLGDDDTINEGAIEKALNAANGAKEYDLIVVNGSSTLDKICFPEKEYEKPEELFDDLWHHMTWISRLIINKEVIDKADFAKYYDTNFIQNGFVFDYLARKKTISVLWKPQFVITPPETDKIINHYNSKLVFLFVKCMSELVLSLPERYPAGLKLKVLRKSLISFATLASMRSKNNFDYAQAKKYKQYFKYVIAAPYPLIAALSVAPVWLLKAVEKPARLMQKLLSKNSENK